MRGLVVENKIIKLSERLEVPSPQKNEVQVKVVCASLNPTDSDNILGKHDFWITLLGKKHIVKTGLEFSGIVTQGGVHFKKGDKVFGYIHLMKGLKTHQEYICIHEDYIAQMPSNVTFEEAAALPLGSLTTLKALQSVGRVTKGMKILINGAAGGLGVYALQIGRQLGAHITAVAGPHQEEFLSGLGADAVINYRDQNIEELPHQYDLILDLSNTRSFKEIKHLLSPHGVFIPAEPNRHLMSILFNSLRSKKAKMLLLESGNREALTRIARWVNQGRLKILVDCVFELSEYQNAFQRLSETGKQGRIILRIGKA